MHTPTLDTAIELAEVHETQLNALLKRFNLTRPEIVKRYMTDPASIPPSILKELHYLDAYARLVNLENYTPVDKEDWRPKDYLDAMMPALYEWAENALDTQNFYLENEICVDMDEQDEKIFAAILAMAIGRDLRIDEQRNEQLLLTVAGGGSAEPDPGAGAAQEELPTV